MANIAKRVLAFGLMVGMGSVSFHESFATYDTTVSTPPTFAPASLVYQPPSPALVNNMACHNAHSTKLSSESLIAKHDAAALYRMGIAYEKGDGQEQNFAIALQLYRLASLKGHTSAQKAIVKVLDKCANTQSAALQTFAK